MKRLLLVNNKFRLQLSIVAVTAAVIFGGWGVFAFAESLSNDVVQHRAELMAQLKALEDEITGFQKLIEQKRSEGASFERDITILNTKIKQTQAQIKAINVQISSLDGKIGEKQLTINQISSKINREQLSLAEALRSLNEFDDYSIIEILMSYEKISDYLGDVDNIDIVQKTLQESFDVLRDTKKQQEVARDDLIDQKQEAGQLKSLQVIAQSQLLKNEKDKQTLLKETKGKESEYKKVVTVKQKDAATIRAQLFLLQGSPSIPFEKAVEYAERAHVKTGVRVAFILGVIAQESDLGRNVGQCNLPDDPPEYKWQKIMKPSRDQAPYLDITSRLGLDPNLMPLSCPMSVGYGGAMGPAQFIPSTWLMYESKIAAATGHKPPNPWSPEDAFMASAIYLGEIGANTVAGERMAAAKYFAGSNWQGSLGRTYANQVLAKVELYQDQIDIISGQ
ncbi:MAG: lytic murein transglycosylase [Patescibacteria group bacterium]